MPLVDTNGIRISAHIQGEGEPLLLHMGIGQQWVIWPPALLDALEAEGFQVIAYDHRDVGESSHLDSLGRPRAIPIILGALAGRKVKAPYSLWDMADDAAGLLESLGIESAHTMGISMGGMVAQAMAIRHPQRVRSLCSMMSTTGSRRYAVGKLRALKTLLKPVPREEEAAIDHVIGVYRTIAGSEFPPDLEGLRERFVLASSRGYTAHGFIRHLAAILSSGSRRHLLEKLQVPTLVIHGAEDPLIPVAAGRATAMAIPGARFVEIPGMGHDLPQHLYGEFSSAIGKNAGLS